MARGCHDGQSTRRNVRSRMVNGRPVGVCTLAAGGRHVVSDGRRGREGSAARRNGVFNAAPSGLIAQGA